MSDISGYSAIFGVGSLSAAPRTRITISLIIEGSSNVSAELSRAQTGASATITGSSSLYGSISKYIIAAAATITCSASIPSADAWVGKPERYTGGLCFTHYDNTESPNAISQDGTYIFAATVPNLYSGVSLKAWHIGAKVGTENSGNDGSNYWTIHVCKSDHPTYTSLDSLNTSAMSTDDWEVLSEEGLDIDLDPDTEGQEVLLIKVVKTGSPGNLALAGPAAYVDQ